MSDGSSRHGGSRVYLGIVLGSIVAGVGYYIKYFLVSDTLEFFPAILSNSGRTFNESTGVLIAILLDLSQLVVLFSFKENDGLNDSERQLKWLIRLLWAIECFALSMPFLVPDVSVVPFRDLPLQAMSNFALTLLSPAFPVAFGTMLLIYGTAVLPEKLIDWISEHPQGGLPIALVGVATGMCLSYGISFFTSIF